MIEVIEGDCLAVLPTLAAGSFSACVCDPPYHLTSIVNRFGNTSAEREQHVADSPITGHSAGYMARGFMGQAWDGGDVAFRPETWRAVHDALLPGGWLVAFGGTRTWHRLACAIEDADFEMRDTLCWLYGSGFPKSHNVSKATDRQLDAARTEVIGTKLGRSGMAKDGSNQRSGFDGAFGGVASGAMPTDILAPATPEAARWSGWGTALKPAWEPIILARKPFPGTVAANVLAHGCGALNIDGSRVTTGERLQGSTVRDDIRGGRFAAGHNPNPGDIAAYTQNSAGRWPANVLHDGSDEVEAAFAAFGGRGGAVSNGHGGTAARFFAACPFSEDELRVFYSGKADAADRADSKHPTVKPIELLKWLVRLITPPGGKILDPFAGSGTTGEAAMLLGFDCTLIERDPQSAADIRHRIKRWSGEDLPLFQDAAQ